MSEKLNQNMSFSLFFNQSLEKLKNILSAQMAHNNLLEICQYALSMSRVQIILLLTDDFILTQEQYNSLTNMVEQRCAHKPLSKILGYNFFYDSKMLVDEHVLDPRLETEKLVDMIRELKPKALLDLGCGSGCISLSALKTCPELAFAVGVDISERALSIAKKNAKALNLLPKIHFYQGNWFAALPSNPLKEGSQEDVQDLNVCFDQCKNAVDDNDMNECMNGHLLSNKQNQQCLSEWENAQQSHLYMRTEKASCTIKPRDTSPKQDCAEGSNVVLDNDSYVSQCMSLCVSKQQSSLQEDNDVYHDNKVQKNANQSSYQKQIGLKKDMDYQSIICKNGVECSSLQMGTDCMIDKARRDCLEGSSDLVHMSNQQKQEMCTDCMVGKAGRDCVEGSSDLIHMSNQQKQEMGTDCMIGKVRCDCVEYDSQEGKQFCMKGEIDICENLYDKQPISQRQMKHAEDFIKSNIALEAKITDQTEHFDMSKLIKDASMSNNICDQKKIAANKFDVIVSNPPYIAYWEEIGQEVKYDPEIALFAKKDGMEHYETIIAQAKDYLLPNGHLLLEVPIRLLDKIEQCVKENLGKICWYKSSADNIIFAKIAYK